MTFNVDKDKGKRGNNDEPQFPFGLDDVEQALGSSGSGGSDSTAEADKIRSPWYVSCYFSQNAYFLCTKLILFLFRFGKGTTSPVWIQPDPRPSPAPDVGHTRHPTLLHAPVGPSGVGGPVHTHTTQGASQSFAYPPEAGGQIPFPSPASPYPPRSEHQQHILGGGHFQHSPHSTDERQVPVQGNARLPSVAKDMKIFRHPMPTHTSNIVSEGTEAKKSKKYFSAAVSGIPTTVSAPSSTGTPVEPTSHDFTSPQSVRPLVFRPPLEEQQMTPTATAVSASETIPEMSLLNTVSPDSERPAHQSHVIHKDDPIHESEGSRRHVQELLKVILNRGDELQSEEKSQERRQWTSVKPSDGSRQYPTKLTTVVGIPQEEKTQEEDDEDFSFSKFLSFFTNGDGTDNSVEGRNLKKSRKLKHKLMRRLSSTPIPDSMSTSAGGFIDMPVPPKRKLYRRQEDTTSAQALTAPYITQVTEASKRSDYITQDNLPVAPPRTLPVLGERKGPITRLSPEEEAKREEMDKESLFFINTFVRSNFASSDAATRFSMFSEQLFTFALFLVISFAIR